MIRAVNWWCKEKMREIREKQTQTDSLTNTTTSMDVFEGTLQHALLTGESQPHEQQTIDCIRSFFHVAQISQSTGSCRVPRASGLQYHIIDARADTDGVTLISIKLYPWPSMITVSIFSSRLRLTIDGLDTIDSWAGAGIFISSPEDTWTLTCLAPSTSPPPSSVELILSGSYVVAIVVYVVKV